MTRTSVDYDRRQHAVYGEGRALSRQAARRWARTFETHLGAARGAQVVDVGSGTGRFARLLAETLAAQVVGVEPSTRMRAVAVRDNAHPHVRYADGSAERIPLDDASCDAALLSHVAHHMGDQEACARELWRVLRPGAPVVLVGVLPESLGALPFLRFFPTARPIADRQSAALGALIEQLTRAGFEPVAREAIEQELAPDLRAYAERIGKRAISTLELIDDADFEAGLRRLRETAGRAGPATAVSERIDLVVLRRDGRPA